MKFRSVIGRIGVLLMLLIPLQTVQAAGTFAFDQAQLESFIEEEMDQAKIPGLAVMIVEGNKTLYQKGFGYADTDEKAPVTDKTLFELGSTSKAFTALALLKAEADGKVKLSDPVTTYLPWFTMQYEGRDATITLGDLMHHTSGIPEKSIGFLPETSGDGALEETVRAVMPLGLNRQPGSRFEYATVNYDLIGLVLEKVTGQSFSTYVQEDVLKPLGLNSTYVGRHMSPEEGMATGYKRNFLSSLTYDAPEYRGNTPAGYVISNLEDLGRWMKIQLGAEQPSQPYAELILRSHEPDRTVAPDGDGSSYAAGWSVFQSGGGQVMHTGNNPNFSSYLGFRPAENLGVIVLANQNSDYTAHIGDGLLKLMIGKEVKPLLADTFTKVDQVAFSLFVAVGVGLLLFVVYIIRMLMQIGRNVRQYQSPTGKTWIRMGLTAVLLGLMAYALYSLPNLLFGGHPWAFVKVWAPQTVILTTALLAVTVAVYGLYAILNLLFPRRQDKSIFSLVVLSIISGFGNAFLIFVINESFVRTDNLRNGLLLYFGLGILMYVFSQRFIRTRIVTYANELVYEKRMQLIDKILQSPYYKLESMEKGRIEATLNNDTEVISRSLNLLVTTGTSAITLLFCFLYLGVMNLYAFLISLVMIAVTVSLYSLIGRQADKVWNETRDIQNVFFRLIQDLTKGSKELRLHRGKRLDFREAMDESSAQYRDKRTEGDLKFANVFVIGELLFVIVIGVVAFVFPEIFKNIPKETIQNYVLVFLYMTGPVNELLNGIPQIVLVRISWQRINEMILSIVNIEANAEIAATAEPVETPLHLELRGVRYVYKNTANEGRTFGVGPINYEFRSGEIVFVTGGNGSGKSTLSKLITGLYAADEGEVLLNGRVVTPEELNQSYSAILSDFHLFDRLYGIELEGREEDIRQYIELMQLSDKVGVENGRFTTTQLSTGQKKRLSLLVTYLEDRPILLFDEWAADQDPEYRRFFYQDLLPQLREKGKCVIVITHDDHYFHLADKMIAMDMGQIRNSNAEEAQRV